MLDVEYPRVRVREPDVWRPVSELDREPGIARAEQLVLPVHQGTDGFLGTLRYHRERVGHEAEPGAIRVDPVLNRHQVEPDDGIADQPPVLAVDRHIDLAGALDAGGTGRQQRD